MNCNQNRFCFTDYIFGYASVCTLQANPEFCNGSAAVAVVKLYLSNFVTYNDNQPWDGSTTPMLADSPSIFFPSFFHRRLFYLYVIGWSWATVVIFYLTIQFNKSKKPTTPFYVAFKKYMYVSHTNIAYIGLLGYFLCCCSKNETRQESIVVVNLAYMQGIFARPAINHLGLSMQWLIRYICI